MHKSIPNRERGGWSIHPQAEAAMTEANCRMALPWYLLQCSLHTCIVCNIN